MIILLCCYHCSTFAADWQVLPQTCVTGSQGEQCEMTLHITMPAATPAPACLYIDNTRLACWQTQEVHTQTVQLTDDSWLFIKDSDGHILFSQKLMVKWESAETRRRVRDPWSLF